MACIQIPHITSTIMNVHDVSDLLGYYLKNKLQQRITVNYVCLGKPLACLYYKD